MDWIRLTDFSIPCIIGLRETERHNPQPLRLEVHMAANLDDAAKGRLESSVDYARIMNELIFLAQEGRWRLLESLAIATARWLLLPPKPCQHRARIERVRVSLAKPEVLGGVAQPGISIERAPEWCVPERRALSDGVDADVLLETSHTGAYRIYIEGRGSYASPPEMMLFVAGGDVQRAGQRIPTGTPAPPSRDEITSTDEGGAVLLALCRPPLQ